MSNGASERRKSGERVLAGTTWKDLERRQAEVARHLEREERENELGRRLQYKAELEMQMALKRFNEERSRALQRLGSKERLGLGRECFRTERDNLCKLKEFERKALESSLERQKDESLRVKSRQAEEHCRDLEKVAEAGQELEKEELARRRLLEEEARLLRESRAADAVRRASEREAERARDLFYSEEERKMLARHEAENVEMLSRTRRVIERNLPVLKQYERLRSAEEKRAQLFEANFIDQACEEVRARELQRERDEQARRKASHSETSQALVKQIAEVNARRSRERSAALRQEREILAREMEEQRQRDDLTRRVRGLLSREQADALRAQIDAASHLNEQNKFAVMSEKEAAYNKSACANNPVSHEGVPGVSVALERRKQLEIISGDLQLANNSLRHQLETPEQPLQRSFLIASRRKPRGRSGELVARNVQTHQRKLDSENLDPAKLTEYQYLRNKGQRGNYDIVAIRPNGEIA